MEQQIGTDIKEQKNDKIHTPHFLAERELPRRHGAGERKAHLRFNTRDTYIHSKCLDPKAGSDPRKFEVRSDMKTYHLQTPD